MLWLKVTCLVLMVKETQVPKENHPITPNLEELSYTPK